MKKFFYSILVFAGLAIAPAANAQKFAHIDYDSLLSIMPEMTKANEDAAAFYKKLENEMLTMQTELDNKLKAYDADKDMLAKTPSLLQMREAELNSLNQRIQNFQMTAQTDLQNEVARLKKPIIDKVEKAIKDYAKEKGYKYVFDSSKSASILLFADPADDIFLAIKTKLNIPNPAPKAPGTGGTTPPPAPGGGTKPAGGGQ